MCALVAGVQTCALPIARVLAPDPNRRMLVQFHPSTTYEDFFEGYRPEETEGQLSYRLTPGPLALLADRAEQAPGQRHVIDRQSAGQGKRGSVRVDLGGRRDMKKTKQ